MNVDQITDLELQVEYLMRTAQELRKENKSLHERLNCAVQDRSELQERHHQAVTQIKKIIGQLKEELA